MSWLNDYSKTTVYNYRSMDENDPCKMVSGTAEQLSETFGIDVKGEPGEQLQCLQTSYRYSYAGFEPRQLGIMTKTTFEKNGRKGVRINHGDGKSTTRSMTRENLLKGKGVKVTGEKRDAQGNTTGQKAFEVESSLTKGCNEASVKAKGDILGNRLKHMKHEIAVANHNAKERGKK